MIHCESCGIASNKGHGDADLCLVCWAKARWSNYIAAGNVYITLDAFLAKERIYGEWILDYGFPSILNS